MLVTNSYCLISCFLGRGNQARSYRGVGVIGIDHIFFLSPMSEEWKSPNNPYEVSHTTLCLSILIKQVTIESGVRAPVSLNVLPFLNRSVALPVLQRNGKLVWHCGNVSLAGMTFG